MKNGEIELINHIWRDCMATDDGKALFNTKYLAKRFLGKHDYLDIRAALRSLPYLKTRYFYIEGIEAKILEATIDQGFCTEECRRLGRILSGHESFLIKQLPEMYK